MYFKKLFIMLPELTIYIYNSSGSLTMSSVPRILLDEYYKVLKQVINKEHRFYLTENELDKLFIKTY